MRRNDIIDYIHVINYFGCNAFLKALLGLIKPLSGSLMILGNAPCNGNQHIGYMPQIHARHSIMRLTGRAFITSSINSTRFGLPIILAQQKNEIETVLHWVEAESYADRPFYQLSGGERQRIYLAQSLLGQPKILLLDEPLSGLDPHYQETFIQLLCNIQKKINSTILFTAHDPNPLLSTMDRVLYFANKKIALFTWLPIPISPFFPTLHRSTDLCYLAVEN